MAAKLYNMSDVTEWEETNERRFQELSKRLKSGESHPTIDAGKGLSSLSRLHLLKGMTAVAREEFAPALGHFAASCEVKCVLYEQYIAGKDIHADFVSTGNFQTLLLTHVTRDKRLTKRFSNLYRLEFAGVTRSPKDSTFIGSLLKALSEDHLEEAREIMNKPRPRVDKQFDGYIECMESIVNKDEKGFVSTLEYASNAWEKFVRRDCKGNPLTVCFIGGVGFIRLAEGLWKKPIKVEIEHIPEALLGEIEPRAVDPGV